MDSHSVYSTYTDYREMTEIDLIDLLYQLLKRWRGLVAALFIGAILGSGYGFVHMEKPKEDKASEAASSVAVNTAAVTGTGSAYLDNMEKLSEGEIAIADNCINDYLKYYKNYLNTVDYGNKSVYLKLDYKNVPTLSKTYLIEDYYVYHPEKGEMVTNINNIVGIYKRMLTGSDVVNRILKETGYDLAPAQISELYTVNLVDDSIMRINVTTDKWQSCKKIMKVLEESVDDYTEQAGSLYDFTITPVDPIYSEYTNDSVFNAQQAQINNVNTIRGNMNNAASTLNDYQKAYYNAIVKEINAAVGNDLSALDSIDIASIRAKIEAEEGEKSREYLAEQEALAKEAEQATAAGGGNDAKQASDLAASSADVISDRAEVMGVRRGRVNLKYLLLGAFLCFFAYCGIVAAVYVLKGTLRTKDDLNSVFRLMVFGQLLNRKENRHKLFKGIDSFIDALFIKESKNYNEDSALSVISSSISNALRTNGKDSLYIALGGIDEKAAALAVKISDLIKKDGLKVTGLGNILGDSTAISDMADSDAVLFIEQIAASRYDSIAGEAELCSSYKKDIIGSVVIR